MPLLLVRLCRLRSVWQEASAVHMVQSKFIRLGTVIVGAVWPFFRYLGIAAIVLRSASARQLTECHHGR